MKTQDMYLGVLFSMEDLSVYGYMTNTKIKFITVLTVPDVIIKDTDMKNVRNSFLLLAITLSPQCQFKMSLIPYIQGRCYRRFLTYF